MERLQKILFEILIRWPIVSIFHLLGWRINREVIEDDKMVITGAPHTSNWDYLIFLWAAAYLRRKIYVTIKKELFFPPLGWFLRFVGGIPVDRASSHNLVDQMVERLKEHKRILLLFTPDGTRSYQPYWKSGFYWTAVEAGLPILLGIPNWKEKRIYVHVQLMPSGDIEKDMEIIREAQEKYGYGLYPENANPVILRPKGEDGATHEDEQEEKMLSH